MAKWKKGHCKNGQIEEFHCKKFHWKESHVEKIPFGKKLLVMQSLVQNNQHEFRGMWNGEVWAKNVSCSVKFFSFNSLSNKRMIFLHKGIVMIVEFQVCGYKIMSKTSISWKSIWIYLKSQIKFWNMKI